MTFQEKLVLTFPLVHYGIVDGLIDYDRDVEVSEDGKEWFADVNIGNDEEGNEYPYTITAHGLMKEKGIASTEGLWLEVDSDYDRNSFKIISGIRIDECV